MKSHLSHTIATFKGDRALIVLALSLIAIAAAYIIYVAVQLSPTELQVATRYTAFGETQYYRTRWYYLLTFIGFAVVLAISHIAIMVKLKNREMRGMAIAFGYLSLIILFILLSITRSVLGIAYLS